MYKIASILLLVVLLILGGLFIWEKRAHSRTQDALHNQVAKTQKTIKEKDDLYSALSVKISDLESHLSSSTKKSQDLKKIIDKRNEEIETITNVSLNWKTKYFKIKNAKDEIIPTNPDTPISPTCKECLQVHRAKVSFEQELDNWLVSGYTLSNPAYAELSIKRTTPLIISLILTKTKTGYRTYLQDENEELKSAKINLMIDDKSFKDKWYEKIELNGSMSVSNSGLLLSSGLSYEWLDGLMVGPLMSIVYNGKKAIKFYGANVGWRMFK